MKNIHIFSALFISLILASCYSVDFVRYTEETYPASASVEVFRSRPIEKQYIEIGELSLRVKKGLFSNQEDVVIKLREKAKNIGADAIIILGEEKDGSVLVPSGNTYTSVDKKYIKAIAIRYIK